MKIQSSLMELKMYEIIRYVSDGKAALRTDACYAGANADFSTRIFVSPDVVGIGQWPIDFARDPVTSSLRLNGNRSGSKLQPSGAPRRIRSCGFRIVLGDAISRVVLRSFQGLIFGTRALFVARIGSYTVRLSRLIFIAIIVWVLVVTFIVGIAAVIVVCGVSGLTRRRCLIVPIILLVLRIDRGLSIIG